MYEVLEEIQLAFDNFVIDTQAIIDEAKRKRNRKGANRWQELKKGEEKHQLLTD